MLNIRHNQSVELTATSQSFVQKLMTFMRKFGVYMSNETVHCYIREDKGE